MRNSRARAHSPVSQRFVSNAMKRVRPSTVPDGAGSQCFGKAALCVAALAAAANNLSLRRDSGRCSRARRIAALRSANAPPSCAPGLDRRSVFGVTGWSRSERRAMASTTARSVRCMQQHGDRGQVCQRSDLRPAAPGREGVAAVRGQWKHAARLTRRQASRRCGPSESSECSRIAEQ